MTIRSALGVMLVVPALAWGQTSDTAHSDSAHADTAPVAVARPDSARPDSVHPNTVRADSTGGDTIFRAAQRLAAEGRGDSARALVGQKLDAAPPGSPAYVDALYWRAVVAATAADAERDLRTIIVTYPASARSADALMRLAQLELARGDRDQAVAHLKRIVVEHPDSPNRPRAAFWVARTLLDEGNLPAGCARLADASRLTPASEVELANQIGYLQQRCQGVDTTAKATAAPAPSRSATSAPTPPAAPQAASGTSAHGRYTVQVAAFSTLASANGLRDVLVARGYPARVVGTAKPFRVRVGRYATRADADAAARAMRAKKLTAYVTSAETP
ncbi:MAG TPA: SPOR domain-containing protein [Gemmatimonadaceae bacterium]